MRLIASGQGNLLFAGKQYRCAIGKSGMTEDKREGDHASPIGIYPLRRVFYRADRLEKPKTALPVREIRPDEGWCDDPGHPLYNTLVTLPFSASHEKMWREDHLYDLVVVLGHNDNPPVPGKGSAIFFHLAKENFDGTEGCIAVSRDDMVEILSHCDMETMMEIQA